MTSWQCASDSYKNVPYFQTNINVIRGCEPSTSELSNLIDNSQSVPVMTMIGISATFSPTSSALQLLSLLSSL